MSKNSELNFMQIHSDKTTNERADSDPYKG